MLIKNKVIKSDDDLGEIRSTFRLSKPTGRLLSQWAAWKGVPEKQLLDYLAQTPELVSESIVKAVPILDDTHRHSRRMSIQCLRIVEQIAERHGVSRDQALEGLIVSCARMRAVDAWVELQDVQKALSKAEEVGPYVYEFHKLMEKAGVQSLVWFQLQEEQYKLEDTVHSLQHFIKTVFPNDDEFKAYCKSVLENLSNYLETKNG